MLRDFGRADKLISQAQSLAPSDTRLLEIQSWIKRRQGDWEGFLETARRALRLEPTNLSHVATLLRRYQTDLRQLLDQGTPAQQLSMQKRMLVTNLALKDWDAAEKNLSKGKDLLLARGDNKANSLQLGMVKIEQCLLSGDSDGLAEQVAAIKQQLGIQELVSDDHDYALVYGRNLHVN